ncbi:MAG TPA: translocation/assembly module TamB domain-containing protein, partial [Burkholderiales bacterium]|nr:translocation/assembly module TamB domain-containing protein [Burkholderiales bacterium]
AGTLKTSGSVSFAGGRREGALDFALDRLSIVDMPGQKLQVSGSGKLALEGARLALTGAIRADQGLIELQEWDRPSLSEDVVIVGRERAAHGGGAAPGLRLALDLDLGENFRVRGAGLNARLVGAIQVRSDDGPTKAKGVVRVAEGSYTAYGQRLQIERGALMFDGQITNPALDILALRKNQRVEAGVAITGTVLSPRTRLVSFPPVPDAEKLSWLILGQGTGGRDDSTLSLPSVGAAAKDSEYVSVGAQITSSLHVGVGRSITGTGTLLKLTYLISDRWSVQTRSGDASGAIVYYTLSFE